MKTAWQWLEEFPPIVVRLVARRGRAGNSRWIDSAEIAIESDIPLARVQAIGECFDWTDVTVGEVRRFCAACRFDPTVFRDREAQRIYLYVCMTRKLSQPPAYLRRHPAWTAEILPLLHRLKSRPPSSKASNASSWSNERSYGHAA